VRISVAGSLLVEDGSAVLRERDLPGNQGRLVLAMLAVEHRHAVGRDRIADELWPDGLPRSWETALRAVISKVRAAAGRAGIGEPLIESSFGCYRLRLGRGTLDVDEAAEALHRAETRLAAADALGAAADAIVACLVCDRPFLDGFHNDWTLRQRERLRELHVAARQVLAEAHAELGDHALSARHAGLALALDPYREPLHQRLIAAHALAGDRLGAARAFDRYRTLLRDELGLEPSRDTVAVLARALGGERRA
jgi:DNA-binding SARP family transcriptional activator